MAYTGPIPLLNTPAQTAPTRVRPAPQRFRRRRSNAAMVSDFMALRKAIFLCHSCEWRMPLRWLSRYTYHLVPGFHGAGSCTKCQEVQSVNIYVPDDDVYMANVRHLASIEASARQTALARTSGKRQRLA